MLNTLSYKITPHWIGRIIRRKLRVKTERYREGYILAASEKGKLDRLFERYGILDQPVNLVNSVNLAEGRERDRPKPRRHLLSSVLPSAILAYISYSQRPDRVHQVRRVHPKTSSMYMMKPDSPSDRRLCEPNHRRARNRACEKEEAC